MRMESLMIVRQPAAAAAAAAADVTGLVSVVVVVVAEVIFGATRQLDARQMTSDLSKS